MKLKKISCLLLLGCAACTSQPDFHKGEYEKVSQFNAPADLSVPKLLWEKIEHLASGGSHGEAGGGGGHGEASGHGGGGGGDEFDSNDMYYVPVHVFLMEETPGALRGKNVELVFGKGGGNLDLADYIDEEAKSDFIFGVDVPGLNEAQSLKVFFLNNGKPRKIAGEVYGIPCNSVLDLSTFFKNQLTKIGQRVTTHRKLYLNMMVGSYVIAFKSGKQWAITQLTLTDSRFPDSLCREQMEAPSI